MFTFRNDSKAAAAKNAAPGSWKSRISPKKISLEVDGKDNPELEEIASLDIMEIREGNFTERFRIGFICKSEELNDPLVEVLVVRSNNYNDVDKDANDTKSLKYPSNNSSNSDNSIVEILDDSSDNYNDVIKDVNDTNTLKDHPNNSSDSNNKSLASQLARYNMMKKLEYEEKQKNISSYDPPKKMQTFLADAGPQVSSSKKKDKKKPVKKIQVQKENETKRHILKEKKRQQFFLGKSILQPMAKIPKLSLEAKEAQEAERQREQYPCSRLFKYNGQSNNLKGILILEGVEEGAMLHHYLVRHEELTLQAQQPGDLKRIRSSAIRSFHRVEDDQEQSDIQHKGWKKLQEATTDEARKKLARTAFSNPMFTDPGQNLTFHGYRRRPSSVSLPLGSFSLVNGSILPMSGSKRMLEDVASPPIHTGVRKRIELTNFGRVMKARFTQTFRQQGQDEITQDNLDSFLIYLKHYRVGLKETANFLSFYAGSKAAYLEAAQAQGVLDTEETYVRSKKVYGGVGVDNVNCEECSFRHKFSQ